MSLALIAGEGMLPEEIARRLALAGKKPFVYALRGDCASLSLNAREVMPLFRSEFRSTIADMMSRGVRQIMLAGVVPKKTIFNPAMMDAMGRELLAGLDVRDDHTLLGGVVALFERAGFEVVGYRDLLSDLMAGDGFIAGREATDSERADVAYGVKIARAVTPLSFGQTVVVYQKSVVAVEAMEGTDETLRRSGLFCRGGVAVKMLKDGQDERYDIPTVGAATVRLMGESGLGCLALQAGRTLILNPEEFKAAAEENNIAVVGFSGLGC